MGCRSDGGDHGGDHRGGCGNGDGDGGGCGNGCGNGDGGGLSLSRVVGSLRLSKLLIVWKALYRAQVPRLWAELALREGRAGYHCEAGALYKARVAGMSLSGMGDSAVRRRSIGVALYRFYRARTG